MGGVFHIAVPALDGVAAGGIDPGPLFGSKGELLAVACSTSGAIVIACWVQSLGGSFGALSTGILAMAATELGRSGQTT